MASIYIPARIDLAGVGVRMEGSRQKTERLTPQLTEVRRKRPG